MPRRCAWPNTTGVVDALPSNRADQPPCILVLPRRPRCDWAIANAHRAHAPDEGVALSKQRIGKTPAATTRNVAKH